MWLTHQLLPQSEPNPQRARAREGFDVLFPLNSSSSIVTPRALPSRNKGSIANSLAQSINDLLQEMRDQGPARMLRVWRARRHCRRELRRLLAVGPHMIADVGLTLDDARKEMGQPFWRAPFWQA